ncbi:hypothetical protein DPMN_183432 [Dreissena polymorpha]|uniref:Uncharacterized protein n=1 Tax=Dreissena polymorpha TaxID=45954 RepID=A0A9D4I6B9_DREPO|nr:hypothetical protein DPMN_183432 [Dreissena polymorpha]
MYTDSELQGMTCVSVTPAGHVLVCGSLSNTILHVDSEGKMKLATLVSRERGGVWNPVSVNYNSATSSVIVGQHWKKSSMCEE